MDDTLLISSLGTIIVTAAVLVLLLKRLFIPAIVTYILVGLLTPSLLSWMLPHILGREPLADAALLPDTIEMIGEVGIALLLFIVGLELNLDKIRDVGKVAFYAGIGQVVFTAAGGFGICLLLGFDIISSIFVAVALTFSSTVVVVKLLDQKNEIESLYGRIAVGIFLVQDMVVILVLTLLAGMGSRETFQLDTMVGGLLKAFLGMGVLLGVSILASRYLLARPFNWAARLPEVLFIWSLGWCFLYVVMAELMGLSPELGAFLAGISLAQLGPSQDLRRRIHPLMSFFVAVFFISLGAQMELGAAREHWWAAAWLSLFVLIGNPFIFMWIIARSGYSEKTSFLTSVTVAQISEFSFIFAAMGLGSGMIEESVLSLIALVGLATIALSSYMILYNHELYAWARRLRLLKMFQAPEAVEEPAEVRRSGHVVVVGLNAMGRRIARQLAHEGETVLSIDRDPQKLEAVPTLRVLGSVEYLSTMEQAQLRGAKLAVSTLKIEDVNNVFAFRCKRLGIPVAIHLFDDSVLEELKRLDVDFVIDSKRFAVGAFLQEIQERGGLD